MMLEALKLIKISFVQNVTLIDEFILKIIVNLNCVYNVTSICCKLNGINMIVLLSKFDEILKAGVNIYVLKFGTCNVV